MLLYCYNETEVRKKGVTTTVNIIRKKKVLLSCEDEMITEREVLFHSQKKYEIKALLYRQ